MNIYVTISYWDLPVLRALFFIVPSLIIVAFVVYLERKIIGAIQLRRGPDVVGPFGLLQSFADAIKTIFKEVIIPTAANKLLFLLAPLLTFGFAVASFAVIPISHDIVFANINMGVSYILSMSALGVYGIIMAGWASNSKYAILGAVRSASQMISYEISIGFSILCVVTLSSSLNLQCVIKAQEEMWFCIPLFPMFIIFFISMLAETNRHPFDLPEAEAELVSGYSVEYSSMAFTMFFLGEYVNVLLMSCFIVILFLGGWLPPFKLEILNAVPNFAWFASKVLIVLCVVFIVRAAIPRYRHDQLMRLGWKVFMPFSIFYFVCVAAFKIL